MDAEIINMRDRSLWIKDKTIETYEVSLEEIAGGHMTIHDTEVEEVDLGAEHEKAILHDCLHDIEIVRDAIDLFAFKEKEKLGLLSSAIGKLLQELSETE